jgi:hypothetical protein
MIYLIYIILMLSLIDIINIEYAIGENLLCNNKVKIAVNISIVCKLFNNIVKNDIEKYYNEYMKRILLKKFDCIITNKMYTIIKNNDRHKNIYKTVEEYDEDLHKLSKQINNVFYEDIMSDLQTIYNEYIFDGSISNSCYETYLFSIMESEYLKLIKYLKNNCEYILST